MIGCGVELEGCGYLGCLVGGIRLGKGVWGVLLMWCVVVVFGLNLWFGLGEVYVWLC